MLGRPPNSRREEDDAVVAAVSAASASANRATRFWIPFPHEHGTAAASSVLMPHKGCRPRGSTKPHRGPLRGSPKTVASSGP
jgi:hypothetical protein